MTHVTASLTLMICNYMLTVSPTVTLKKDNDCFLLLIARAQHCWVWLGMGFFFIEKETKSYCYMTQILTYQVGPYSFKEKKKHEKSIVFYCFRKI